MLAIVDIESAAEEHTHIQSARRGLIFRNYLTLSRPRSTVMSMLQVN